MNTKSVNQKAFSTVQAKAAMLSALLLRIEGDDGTPLFVLTRDALTVQLMSIYEVQRLLDQLAVDATIDALSVMEGA